MSCVGQPEEAVIVDRVRCFLAAVGQVEGHDGVWNRMFTHVVHDKLLTGKEDVKTGVVVSLGCGARHPTAIQSGMEWKWKLMGVAVS